MGENSIQLFGDRKIRIQWDAESEKWYFSVVDIVEVKQRLKAECNETVTICHALKMLVLEDK